MQHNRQMGSVVNTMDFHPTKLGSSPTITSSVTGGIRKSLWPKLLLCYQKGPTLHEGTSELL